MNTSEIRKGARRALEERGYRVSDIGSGSGVPRNTRLRIEKAGKTQDCVVRVGAKGTGRIRFDRKNDGSYKVLSDMDLVIFADSAPELGESTVKVLAFSRDTILDAFEKTRLALESESKENYKIWLSPYKENQPRFLGSGYASERLWSHTVNMATSSKEIAPTEGEPVGARQESVAQVLMAARTRIAELTGMPPEAIHLDLNMVL